MTMLILDMMKLFLVSGSIHFKTSVLFSVLSSQKIELIRVRKVLIFFHMLLNCIVKKGVSWISSFPYLWLYYLLVGYGEKNEIELSDFQDVSMHGMLKIMPGCITLTTPVNYLWSLLVQLSSIRFVINSLIKNAEDKCPHGCLSICPYTCTF